MSKRYVCGMGFTSEDKPIRIIHDKVEDKDYYLFANLCKIMNEQQATIEQKDKEIKELKEKIQRIYVNVCSAMSEVIDDE